MHSDLLLRVSSLEVTPTPPPPPRSLSIDHRLPLIHPHFDSKESWSQIECVQTVKMSIQAGQSSILVLDASFNVSSSSLLIAVRLSLIYRNIDLLGVQWSPQVINIRDILSVTTRVAGPISNTHIHCDFLFFLQ
jgi:hypothetical protein